MMDIKIDLRTSITGKGIQWGSLPVIWLLWCAALSAQELPKVKKVELQPLAAQVKRLVEAMDYLGVPLRSTDKQSLARATGEPDPGRAAVEIQDVLDKYCLLDIHINPESR